MPTKNPTPEQVAAWEAARSRRRTNLTLAPETLEALERLSAEREVSISRVVDEAVAAFDAQNAKTPAQP